MAEGESPIVLIELDSRRRAALGRLAHHDRYLVREEPDGTLVLTPAVVMAKQEAELLRGNPSFVASMREKMTLPDRLQRRPLPRIEGPEA